MADLLQVSDLEKAKLHDTFHSEVITGKAGGLAGGADIDFTTNAVTGQVQATLPKLLSQVGFAPVDFDFTTGGTLTNRSQSIFYETDGNWYSWGGTIPKTIPPASSPVSTGGIAVNAWNISTSAFMYRDYRGVKDELYSQAGIIDNGTSNQLGNSQFVDSLNRLFNKNFDSIQSMLASTTLKLGQKLKTGATTWKVVTSNKGWDTATTGLYAMPLNGVWVDDAGADPLGNTDSYAAIMFVLNKYNADAKLRFGVVFSSGYYKTSEELALHGGTSGIRINGNGAQFEATANMNALISCPSIYGLTLVDFSVSHAVGVTISKAMIHINNEENANKTTRHNIGGITAGLVTGAPCVLLVDKMWESKIGRIRVDRDVTGMTGDIVVLRSCVNIEVASSEIGYCNTAWRLSGHPNVGYGCEGITFNGGITTFAKIPIAIDRGTAIRMIGMVLDFCETSGPVFSNGSDVTMTDCWVANTASSVAGWNGFVSISGTSAAKLSKNNFINNSTNTAYCASLNSTSSSFTGNTSSGCLSGFRREYEVSEYGNTYSAGGVARNLFKGKSLALECDAGFTGTFSVKSGVTTNASGQLLSRFEFTAPLLNAGNSFQMDHYQGAFADIPEIRLSWNGVPFYGLEPASGNFRLYTAGGGIILKSPDGLVTKTLTISNAGALVLI